MTLFSGELLMSSIYLLWSLAGIWGSVSLWRVTFNRCTRLKLCGLVCGILAMTSWALILLADLFTFRQIYDRQPVSVELFKFWLFCGQIITALFYLIMPRCKKFRAAGFQPTKD